MSWLLLTLFIQTAYSSSSMDLATALTTSTSLLSLHTMTQCAHFYMHAVLRTRCAHTSEEDNGVAQSEKRTWSPRDNDLHRTITRASLDVREGCQCHVKPLH